MTYKELIKKLPTGWHQVDLKTYQRVVNQTYFFELKEGEEDYALQQIDNSLLTIAALMQVDVDVLKGYQVTEYVNLISRIQWVNVLPQPSTVKPAYIKDNIEVTLDNYLTFQAIASDQFKAIENIKGVMELFVKAPSTKKHWYSKNAIVIPDADSMNMIDVFTFFFFVQALLKKSLRRTQQTLTKKLLVARMQQRLGVTPTAL